MDLEMAAMRCKFCNGELLADCIGDKQIGWTCEKCHAEFTLKGKYAFEEDEI